MPDITLAPLPEGIIYLDESLVKFDGFLFNNLRDSCMPDSHMHAYGKMQDFLRLTNPTEYIALFLTAIDSVALGAISGFINFVPNQLKEIETASQRILTVWISNVRERDSNPVAFYQHAYTFDKKSGIYYGRTIARMDQLFGKNQPVEKGKQ